jgi:hypothetical protein
VLIEQVSHEAALAKVNRDLCSKGNVSILLRPENDENSPPSVIPAYARQSTFEQCFLKTITVCKIFARGVMMEFFRVHPNETSCLNCLKSK